MKNNKNPIWTMLVVCAMIVFSACEKKDVHTEIPISLDATTLVKTTRYDSYLFEIPKTDGRHLVAKNEKTGSLLYARMRRGDVVGFEIRPVNARVIILDKKIIPENQSVPWDIDFCPDGWDAKLICYINNQGVEVSYLRCTPTSLTIGLEPEW